MTLISKLRKEKKFTQEQLSKILKVSQSYICKLEEGKIKPNAIVIARLWRIFPDKRNEIEKYFDILYIR